MFRVTTKLNRTINFVPKAGYKNWLNIESETVKPVSKYASIPHSTVSSVDSSVNMEELQKYKTEPIQKIIEEYGPSKILDLSFNGRRVEDILKMTDSEFNRFLFKELAKIPLDQIDPLFQKPFSYLIHRKYSMGRTLYTMGASFTNCVQFYDLHKLYIKQDISRNEYIFKCMDLLLPLIINNRSTDIQKN